jgi:hypothetical protein
MAYKNLATKSENVIGRPMRKMVSDEELVQKLRDFEETYGHPPTAKELDDDKEFPCANTYRNRFGSLGTAMMLAGFAPRRQGRQFKH